ncbi:hypothetical protein EI77_03402 [Prosthecobacter fusiformis]|uniref:Uncharacterized protein n=1 Tax=Prosthecobacter fusiformis TaxID=48464 RepID=A0A4R7RP24_9BACT|nr:hypothetical protein EI77_03402 [Prosthecobacter fusiformis]
MEHTRPRVPFFASRGKPFSDLVKTFKRRKEEDLFFAPFVFFSKAFLNLGCAQSTALFPLKPHK